MIGCPASLGSWHYSLRRIRTRSSTLRTTSGSCTRPIRPRSRPFDVARSCSHMMNERRSRSDCSGVISRWVRMSGRSVVVSGIEIMSPAGPSLNRVSERTKAGRSPCCSCPRVGEKSTHQRSPRRGTGEADSETESAIVRELVQAIVRGPLKFVGLPLVFPPVLPVVPKPSKPHVGPAKKLGAPAVFKKTINGL